MPKSANVIISDNWSNFLELLHHAFNEGMEIPLFRLFMTPEERKSYVTRFCIVKELISGKVVQRQLKNELGVGIATITRGSNSLKEAPIEFKQWLEIYVKS